MGLWACMHQTLSDKQNEDESTDLWYIETDCIEEEISMLTTGGNKSENKGSQDGIFVWMNISALVEEEATDIFELWDDPESDFSFPYMDRKHTTDVVNAFLSRSASLLGANDLLDGMRLFLNAIFGYIISQVPSREQNLETVAIMLNAFELREGKKAFKNAIDMLFDDLMKEEPECEEVKDYQKFRSLPVSTQVEILMACSDKLESLGYDTEVYEHFADFDPFADYDDDPDQEEDQDEPHESRDER